MWLTIRFSVASRAPVPASATVAGWAAKSASEARSMTTRLQDVASLQISDDRMKLLPCAGSVMQAVPPRQANSASTLPWSTRRTRSEEAARRFALLITIPGLDHSFGRRRSGGSRVTRGGPPSRCPAFRRAIMRDFAGRRTLGGRGDEEYDRRPLHWRSIEATEPD